MTSKDTAANNSIALAAILLLSLAFGTVFAQTPDAKKPAENAQISAKKKAEALVIDALKNYKNGQYNKAEQEVFEATQLRPDNAIYWKDLGYCYRLLSAKATYTKNEKMQIFYAQKGVEAFKKSLSIKNGDEETWSCLDILYIQEKGLDEGIAYFKSLEKRYPDNARLAQIIAKLYSLKENFNETLNKRMRDAEAHPEDIVRWNFIAKLCWNKLKYNSKGLSDEQAISLLSTGYKATDKVVALNENDFEAHSFKNLLYLEEANIYDNKACHLLQAEDRKPSRSDKKEARKYREQSRQSRTEANKERIKALSCLDEKTLKEFKAVKLYSDLDFMSPGSQKVLAIYSNNPETPSGLLNAIDPLIPVKVTYRGLPVYPPKASALQIGGKVVAQVIIDRTGKVSNARILRSSNRIFNEAVLEAAKRWRFSPPTKLSGEKVSVYYVIPFRFEP